MVVRWIQRIDIARKGTSKSRLSTIRDKKIKSQVAPQGKRLIFMYSCRNKSVISSIDARIWHRKTANSVGCPCCILNAAFWSYIRKTLSREIRTGAWPELCDNQVCCLVGVSLLLERGSSSRRLFLLLLCNDPSSEFVQHVSLDQPLRPFKWIRPDPLEFSSSTQTQAPQHRGTSQTRLRFASGCALLRWRNGNPKKEQ